MDFVLQNPGPAVISSNGGKDAIVWVFDENARRSARLTGPKAPQPVLYAIDPMTLKVIWKSAVGLLQASGKYNSPTVADGTAYVGTDRIVAFGIGGSNVATAAPRSEFPVTEPAAVPAPAGNRSGGPSEVNGKAVMQRACVQCHEIGVVTGTRYTEAGWRQMVDSMVQRGAVLSDPETEDVIAYLTKNFGKMNVNKATAAQIEEELGLTEEEARAIVSYREQHGDIKSLEQLKSVPGVSADKIQAKAAAIAFRDSY
jgi:competence protein ComEA